MSETSKSLFYNSENGDRVYDADSFEHLLKKFFTSGVFTGSCQVTADGSGMICSVGTGYANCDGKIRLFDSAGNLFFDNAHATYDRIDTVVVERNDTDREITLKVVKGAYSATPMPTAPVRTNYVYQMVLAEVYIAAGITAIYQSMITDKRPDTDVCGYVISAVQTPDFSELFAQFEAQASEFVDTQTDEFLDWFDAMKDQLSEDAAGHLQQEIDAMEDEIDRISDAMSYVVNGNKSIESVTIPVGAYVRLANSEIVGRSDGIYTVKVAIPVDTVIDSSYFNEAAPIAGGLGNALNDNITTLTTAVNSCAKKGYYSEDLNQIRESGLYGVWAPQHGPSGVTGSYAIVIVVKWDASYVFQLFNCINSYSANLYHRVYNNGSWGDWKLHAGS